MKTIRITGSAARAFMAMVAVNSDGEKALDNTTGPMREAIQDELSRCAAPQPLICLSCGAEKLPDIDLPCGH